MENSNISRFDLAIYETILNNTSITKINHILNKLDLNTSQIRAVRQSINKLVCSGYPIGSLRGKGKLNGYYIIKNNEDKINAIHTLESFIAGNIERLEALKTLEV